jgi:CheY-like chemotaxis protein
MARILIVEDETIIAEDIRASLEETGFTIVATAVSGEEAVRIAASEMPDAVLMDIYLRNEMDGTEAAEIIHRKHGIPIIFLTAFSDDALLEKARQAGPFGFLIKPFDSRELKTTLEMALYKARADEERRIRNMTACAPSRPGSPTTSATCSPLCWVTWSLPSSSCSARKTARRG